MDRDGKYVANLRKEDFRVYEDGVEQQISYFGPVEKPFTVVLMLDVRLASASQGKVTRDSNDWPIEELRFSTFLVSMSQRRARVRFRARFVIVK